MFLPRAADKNTAKKITKYDFFEGNNIREIAGFCSSICERKRSAAYIYGVVACRLMTLSFLKLLKNICVGFLISLFYFYEFPFPPPELDLPFPELFLSMSVF